MIYDYKEHTYVVRIISPGVVDNIYIAPVNSLTDDITRASKFDSWGEADEAGKEATFSYESYDIIQYK